MNNKLYDQYDEETLDLLTTVDMLRREVIELQAEVSTLKAIIRDK